MVLYTVFLIVSLSLVFLFNVIFIRGDMSIQYLAISLLIYFLIELIIDIIVAIGIHKIPARKVNYKSRLYKVYPYERKFYEKIGIRSWKGKIPELGALCDFKKDKLYRPDDPNYMHQFIIESCLGESIHFLSLILSFTILFIPNRNLVISMALPVSFINAIIHLLPALVQRYVRPRLVYIYESRLKK